MIKKTQTQRLLNRLFNAISATVEDLGYADTISLLQNGRKIHTKQSNQLDICAEAVITVFDMSKADLFNGTHKKYPRKYAFGIYVYLCFYELKISLSDVAKYHNKNKSGISRAKTTIESMKLDNKFNENIQKKLRQCTEKLREMKTQEPNQEQHGE